MNTFSFSTNKILFSFRIKAEKSAKKEGDIFDAKKEGYKPSEQRKKDQVEVDKQVNMVPSDRDKR